DLGTTSSTIAILDDGKPVVVPNAEGFTKTPSVVAFTGDGEVLVGQLAVNQLITNVDRTFRSAKRRIGSQWATGEIDGYTYLAQEISAHVLLKLKRDAEDYFDRAVSDVVITVPAYFDDARRQATRDAARIAGLNVVRIISEPTAAALGFHLEKE